MKFETDFEVSQICIAIKDGAQLVKIISFSTDGENITAYVHPIDKERWSNGFTVPEAQLIALPVDEDGEYLVPTSAGGPIVMKIGNAILDMIPSAQVLKLSEIREESRKKRLAVETPISQPG